MWKDANIFSTHNGLPDSKSDFENIFFSFLVIFHNNATLFFFK